VKQHRNRNRIQIEIEIEIEKQNAIAYGVASYGTFSRTNHSHCTFRTFHRNKNTSYMLD